MKHIILSLLCAFALPLASSRAVTTGPIETLSVHPADDPTCRLQWIPHIPSTPGPWPIALVYHGGGFHGGGPNSADVVNVCDQLAAHGFLALSATYRVVGNGIQTQTTTGQWPQQTADVKMEVRAARADSRCLNEIVMSVGGSAGGTHALSVAIEHESTSAWTPADRVACAVVFSPATKFEDRTAESYTPNPVPNFATQIRNYTGTTNLTTGTPRQSDMSPVNFIDSTASPIMLVFSDKDPMPSHQYGDLVAALDSKGVTNYVALPLITGTDHAFANWDKVAPQVLAFMDAAIAPLLPTPSPTATPTPTETPTPTNTPTPTPTP